MEPVTFPGNRWFCGGARQVGKTTAVKQFAVNYEQFIYLNLETDDAKSFEGERDIHKIVDRIFFLKDGEKGEG